MNNLSNVHKNELKSEDLNQAVSEIQLVLIHPAAGMLMAPYINQDPHVSLLCQQKFLGLGSRETLRQAVL